MKKISIKEMTTIGILSALAVVVSFLAIFPLVPTVAWLRYDPKDIIVVIGGFIYGPFSAFLISFISSLLEMIFKGGGIFDLIMNVISTCAFACVAALIYKRKHTKEGAIIGLVAGIVCTTFCMIIWNYIVTPIYYKMDRTALLVMWMPGIILFNLLKAGLNAGITLFLYKNVVTILRKTNLVENSDSTSERNSTLFLLGIFITATIVCIVLVIQGII